MVVDVDVGEDVSDDFTSGTAVAIRARHLVKGPVTAADPLRVLGQIVIVTADTELADGLVPASLSLGDILLVSGYADINNGIQATRLERKPAEAKWKLVGPVSGLAGNLFQIGMQAVDFTGVTPSNCGTGLADGDLVKITASPDMAFTPGSTLSTVTGIECKRPGLEIPEGAGPTLEAEIEGFVTSINPLEFSINGQRIVTTSNTEFEGGAIEDIILGAKAEAQGVLDTATGILTADSVRFRDTRVRIRAPLASADIVVGESLTVLGITVRATRLTEDRDSTIALGLGDVQIEVRGFLDRGGNVLATEIKESAPVMDFNDVRLRGPVTSIAGQPIFQMLGVVNVDTTGMTLLGAEESPISETEFFGQLTTSSQVEVEKGAYNPTTNTIFNGQQVAVIEIED